tara:strand:+ start:200 stop:532 length:333 start_codon:yes stop_codon:yes gene_type:complete
MSEEDFPPPVAEFVLDSMDDFVLKTKDTSMRFMHPSINQFMEFHSKINVGCGCNRKKRLARAEESYAKMVTEIVPNVDVEVAMTRLLQAYRIVFRHNGRELGYFGTPRDT